MTLGPAASFLISVGFVLYAEVLGVDLGCGFRDQGEKVWILWRVDLD